MSEGDRAIYIHIHMHIERERKNERERTAIWEKIWRDNASYQMQLKMTMAIENKQK